MEPGQVIAGRWRIEGTAPARGGVARWRAVALDTGDPVEILGLRGPVGDATARSTYLDVHRQLSGLSEPGLVDTRDVIQEGRKTWVVRAPLEDATLADIVGPLDAGRVAAIGAALLPAVLAAGGTTAGALRPDDLGLDARGQPVVAPRGAPITAVARGTTRSVAPESFAGGRPDGRSGLYGLGTLLYELATGRPPTVSGTDATRAPPPPPSALRHGLPPELDQAILALMSADPAERPGALPLLQAAATQVGDLRDLVRAPTTGGEVRYTVGGSESRTGTRVADPTAAVVLPASALADLDPAQRSHAAGLAAVSMATLDALQREGLPLVLRTSASASATRTSARDLSQQTGLPATAATAGMVPAWLAWSATLALTFGTLGLAVLTGLLLGIPVAILPLLFALVVGAAGTWVGLGASATRAAHAGMTEAHRQQHVAVQARSVDGRFDAAWTRLAELRVQLARLDLPEAAASDLRSAMRDVERRLDGLARVARTTERTLSQVDASALRTRLKGLNTRAATDPKAREDRDRLARTVADLDAVEASRSGVQRELAEVHDALDEVAGVFGQLADPGAASDGLQRLTDSTRLVREAIADALPGEDPEAQADEARRAAALRARQGRPE